MQSPLSMQEDAHFRDASGPSPERTISSTPEMTATGEASVTSAGPTLGQTSTHLPQVTQASSMSLTRSFKAASKLRSVMGGILRRSQWHSDSRCCLGLGYHVPCGPTRAKLPSGQFERA